MTVSTRLGPKTSIAGVDFLNSLMNGAYVGSKKPADIKVFAESASGGVVIGSLSVKARRMNDGGGFYRHPEGWFALNSYGLPNQGISFFKNHLPKMVQTVHDHNKPVIVNVLGFTDKDWIDLIELSETSGADMVELNFGCPNVWEEETQKQILSYHPDLIAKTLKLIARQRPKVKIIVKISPLPPDLLNEAAEVISSSGIVSAVTATNSYPNAWLPSEGATLLAGMTGPSLKPISLGVVKQLYQILPKEIDIIGCGGITTPQDVADYLASGAKAVQVVTALMEYGPEIFKTLLAG